ncbi:MAG: tripartite tricarboxylate transporter substrate binding protein [Pseudomonadota bacterium]
MLFARLKVLAQAFVPLALMISAAATQAQNFPDRPIKIIVPFGAGSAVDTIARTIAAQVSEQIGQSVLIDNRTGANGIIAAEAAAKSAPDGYTLFMPNDGIMAANPALYPKLPYDSLKDFTPVTLTSTVPLVLVGNPAFPAKTVPELIAMAKAQPGVINYSSTGSGSAQHLAMEFFIDAAGIKMTHVPYKAMGPALTDVVAGTVPLMFSGMSNVLAFVKDGKLRLYGVSTPKRSAALPDAPTIAEAGLPGYGYAAWNGIVAPAATPPDVVRRLHSEFAKAIANPAVKAKLASLGFDLVGAGPEEFGNLIKNDVARLGKLVRAAGIQVN